MKFAKQSNVSKCKKKKKKEKTDAYGLQKTFSENDKVMRYVTKSW